MFNYFKRTLFSKFNIENFNSNLCKKKKQSSSHSNKDQTSSPFSSLLLTLFGSSVKINKKKNHRDSLEKIRKEQEQDSQEKNKWPKSRKRVQFCNQKINSIEDDKVIAFCQLGSQMLKTVMMPMKRRNWHLFVVQILGKILLREVKEMLNQPTDTNWVHQKLLTLFERLLRNAVEASDGERVFAKHTSKILARNLRGAQAIQ